MVLSIISLLVAAIVGVIVYLIAKKVPFVAEKPLPVLLGLLAAIAVYIGLFSIVL